MIGSRPFLVITTVAEAVTGALLLADPMLVIRLLLGSLAAGPVTMARICGLALVSVAVACWPRRLNPHLEQACVAMLLYNSGVGVLLAFVGVSGPVSGILLWPAAIFHFLMAASLAVTMRKS